MTITVFQPSSPARIGPGISVYVQLTVNVPMVGDVFSLFDDTSTLQGSVILDAARTLFPIVCGINRNAGDPIPQAGGLFYQPQAGLADNSALNVHIRWDRAGGALVEQDDFGGYTWDAVSGLYFLIPYGGGGGHDPMLDTILAAVQKTFS